MKWLAILLLTASILFIPKYGERAAYPTSMRYGAPATVMMSECYTLRMRYNMIGVNGLLGQHERYCEGIPRAYAKSEPEVQKPKGWRAILEAILRLFKLQNR